MKYKKHFIVVFVLFFIVTAGFLLYRHFFTLYITSTNPNLNSISYQSPFIKLYFNKELDTESVKINDPNNIFFQKKITSSAKEMILHINTSNLRIDEQVSFDIHASSEKEGYVLEQKISFTPKDIPYDKLPEDQKRFIKEAEDKKPSYYQDPILEKLPYSTLEYNIRPDFVTDGFNLEVTVLLSNVDIKEGREAAINRYYENALAYIQSIKPANKEYSVSLVIREP